MTGEGKVTNAEIIEVLEDALSALDYAEIYGLYQPGSLGDADVKDNRRNIIALLSRLKAE